MAMSRVPRARSPSRFELAKRAAEGWDITLVRVTDDRCDSRGLTVEETIERNRTELEAAATIMGVGEIIELGYDKVQNPFDLADRMDKLRNLNAGPLQIYVQRGDMLFYELIRP